ncbi:MAG TPA: DUF4395 domain-containing protein, partial [Kribbella sp.]
MSSQSTAQHPQVDPRGLRFAAAVTTVVLALTLVLNSFWPLAVQTVVFAIAVTFGVHASPYSQIFKRLVRPRLGPPKELEDPAPPRFA